MKPTWLNDAICNYCGAVRSLADDADKIIFVNKEFINDKGWFLLEIAETTTGSPSSSLIVSQALYPWMSREIIT
jgi:hypothetical protein